MKPAADVALSKRLAAEAIGTAFLVCAIVAAGTIASHGGGVSALLATSLGVSAMLLAVTLAFSNISGAHFNPAITLAAAWMGDVGRREALLYTLAQTAGAIAGVCAASMVAGDPLYTPGAHALEWRRGEFLAAFGLVAVVFGARKASLESAALGIAGYMAAAAWFAPALDFGNPAIALARAAISSPAAIDLVALVSLLAGQFGGAALAALVMRWFAAAPRAKAAEAAATPLHAVAPPPVVPAPARRCEA